MWRDLPHAAREAFKADLEQLPAQGQGGRRAWAPVSALSHESQLSLQADSQDSLPPQWATSPTDGVTPALLLPPRHSSDPDGWSMIKQDLLHTVKQDEHMVPSISWSIADQHLLAQMSARVEPVDLSADEPPDSPVDSYPNITPEQQALHVARQRMQSCRTCVEIFLVVHTLALALGASRAEHGTIKALYAVLRQLDHPRKISDKEAYTTSGASLSTFAKWRRRVHGVRLPQRRQVMTSGDWKPLVITLPQPPEKAAEGHTVSTL